MRVVLVFIISLVFFNVSYASTEDSIARFQVVKDLRSEILVYDSDFSSYVPYNSEIHYGTKSITIKIDRQDIRQYPLIALVSPGTSIFFDNKLYTEKPDKEWIVLDDKAVGEAEWLTLFQPRGRLPFDNIFHGIEVGRKSPSKQVVNKLEARPHQALVFHNFFIIIFIVILCALTLSKIFNNKAFTEFYNIQRNTLAIGKDQSYIFKKPLNSNNLLSILIHSLIFVYVFFVIQHFTGGMINLPLFNAQTSLGEMLGNYFIYTSIVYVVYVLKYFLISFISYLYNLKEYKHTHFFNWMKLSMIFYLVMFPLIGLVYIWRVDLNLDLIKDIVFFALIVFSIGKILVITYNLNKIRQFRNLYLFSYLCVTEIIPLFIVFKLLI